MPIPNFGWDDVDTGGYNTPGGPKSTTLAAPPDDSLLGGDNPYWRNFYMQQYGKGPRSPVAFQTGNQDQARLEQQRVIQDLQRSAAGDMNSQAQQQLAGSYGDARAQQSSLGSTMRGQSAGAAMRGIQQGQGDIQRGFAGDQQMLKLQEQQAAQAMLAQMLAQQQGQDITQAQGMAQGTLGSQGLDDALKQFYLGGALNMDLQGTERDNQVARARMGFQDQMTALTQQMLKSGTAAGAGALGTLGTMDTSGGPQHSNPYDRDRG